MTIGLLIYELLCLTAILGSLLNVGKFRTFRLNPNDMEIETFQSKSYPILFVVILTVCVFICVTRPESLPDYKNYREVFYSVHDSFEISFTVIKRLAPDFGWLLAAYSLISVSVKLYVIRSMSANIWISLLVFFSVSFVLHDLIQIRAGVAGALCLLSVKYIVYREWKYYYVIILLAILFHNSAIIFVPLYFLNPTKINKALFVSLIPISIFLFITHNTVGHLFSSIPVSSIKVYAAMYLFSNEAQSTIGPIWLMKSLIAVVCVMRINKLNGLYPYSVILLKIWILGLISFPLFMDLPIMSLRISELLNLTQILTFAMAPLCFKGRYRILISLLVIIIATYDCYTSWNLYILNNV